jgi:hypothetical protein
MTVMPNISKNRLKFKDDENKVLVKDFSTLVDNQTLNDAPQALVDNALMAVQDAKASLAGLQTPMGKVTEALNSGSAASEMVQSIQSTVSSNLPDLRATASTLTSVTSSAQQYAGQMTQSVMGTVNSAMAQVPAAIGKVSQISAGVKAQLLKTSVGDFASTLSSGFQTGMTSASNLLKTTVGIQNGVGQAARSISAAKQSFTGTGLSLGSDLRGGRSLTLETFSLPQLNTQTLSSRITQTLHREAGTVLSQTGTTSQLLPVYGAAGKVGVDTSPPPEIEYTDHALAVVFAGVTWYRSLYTYLFEHQTSFLDQNFGTANDHYAVLCQQGTDLQSEQLRNFESLVATNTPDNTNKGLFVYRRYQAVVDSLVTDLPTLTDRARIQATLAYLGQTLSATPIAPLMTAQDYDQLSAAVSALVYSAQTNAYNLPSVDSYPLTYQEAFNQLVTDAVVYHRGTPADIIKRAEASGEIAMFLGVWVMRTMLQAYTATKNTEEHSRLTAALQTISTLSLETITHLYTDFHGLVHQGDLVVWRPSSRAISELGFPFLKHYLTHRTAIAQARVYLTSSIEQAVFDALTLRLDALIESGMPSLLAIADDSTAIDYSALSPSHQALGAALALTLLSEQRYVTDASTFPDKAFEVYYTTPDHLYFDTQVALLR